MTLALVGAAAAVSATVAAPAADAATTAPGTGDVPVTCAVKVGALGSTNTYHWTANFSTAYPASVPANSTLPAAPAFYMTITTDTGYANLVRSQGLLTHPTSFISGPGNTVPWSLNGAVLLPGSRGSAIFNIPTITFPATGPIVVTGTSAGTLLETATGPGTITANAGSFGVSWTDSILNVTSGTCTFDTANPAFATITVAPAVGGGIASEGGSGLLTASGIGVAAAGALAAGGAAMVGRRRKAVN